MHKVRVLVVDDNETFLRGATLALWSLRSVEVADTVASGVDALAVVQKQAPDMVLLDFNMPQMNGIETAWRLRAMGYAGRIVLMSLSDEDAIRDGRNNLVADAFVHKLHFVDGVNAVVEQFFPRQASDACCA